jgi:hypothetical protein
MRSSNIKSELNFGNIMSSTFKPKSVLWPRSSHVASFSPMYNQAPRARYWRGAMCWDRKSNSTISDVKPCLARN